MDKVTQIVKVKMVMSREWFLKEIGKDETNELKNELLSEETHRSVSGGSWKPIVGHSLNSLKANKKNEALYLNYLVRFYF